MRHPFVFHKMRYAGTILLLLAMLLLIQAARALASQLPAENEPAETFLYLVGQPRHFYVSMTNVSGDDAINSCADGYHLASVWEILDVTDLVYASDHAAAKLLTDQGSGPAAGWWGWARTGGAASVANVAGRANCNAWASSTSGEYGTLVRLNPDWTDSATTISSWEAQTWSCAGTAPVWCVSDPVFGVWLPTMVK
jgi:hypothetical protein